MSTGRPPGSLDRPHRSAPPAGRRSARLVAVGPGPRNALAYPPRAHLLPDAQMIAYPIELAKVQPPPLSPATLSRRRLLDWLTTKIHRRVILVTADAGYGKTTLLADFARHCRLRTLWYRMDDDDRDWIGVLSHLVACGREAIPGFAPHTVALLRDLATGSEPREAIVSTFVREFAALGREPTVFILDDYHHADAAPDVRAIFRQLLARAPERTSFVFASRRRPNLPLSRWWSQDEVAELTSTDLRFTEDEVEALFRDVYRQPLESDLLRRLAQRTEGWVASLHLVQAALRERAPREARAFVAELVASGGPLYDYLAEEVVGDQEDELQRFLMCTALLQAVDVRLGAAAAALSQRDASRLIDAAERLGLLTRRRRGHRQWRYHPLVQDFLTARLHREVGAAGVAEIHRKIAAVAADPDEWRLAAHHLAAAGDVGAVHRVIEQATPTIMATGEFAPAEAFVLGHPADPPNPIFGLFLSRQAFYRNRIVDALAQARQAAEQLQRRSHPATDLALLNLASIEFMAGDRRQTLALAQELLERSTDRTIRGIAEGLLGLIEASQGGNLDKLEGLLLRLEKEQREARQTHYLAVTKINLAIVYRCKGSPTDCDQAAQEALDLLDTPDREPERAAALAERCWSLAHMGRWAEAQELAKESASFQNAMARSEFLTEWSDVLRRYGDRDQARRTLLQALDQAPPIDSLQRLWRLAAAEQAIHDGRLEEAFGHLQLDTGIGDVEMLLRKHVLAARLLIERGDPSANVQLQAAERLASAQGAHFWERYCRVLAAALCPDDQTFNDILGALVASGHSAYLSICAEVLARQLPRCSPDLLEALRLEADRRASRWRPALRDAVRFGSSWETKLAAGSLLEQVGERRDVPLLRGLAKELRPRGIGTDLGKKLARATANRVWVEDQGRVSLVINGLEIPGTEVRRKALALLCFLISRPGMAATKDQVLEALWPESDPSTASNSLNQILYFLRRTFDPEFREDLSPPYVHCESEMVWVDQELIQARSARCQNLLRQIGPDPEPKDVERLSLEYRGRFALDFEYEDWARAYRDWMHAAYLHIIERALEQDLESGHFARGIDIARRALAADPEADGVEVALIRLYKRAGAHTAAAEQYAHYAAACREQLGIEPPPLDRL